MPTENQYLQKKYIIIAVAALVLIAVTTILLLRSPEDTWLCEDGAWVKHGSPKEDQPVTGCGDPNLLNSGKACTEEAKLCSDGSSVGRTGPDCEFAVCPPVNSILAEEEARTLAEESCIKGGEALGFGIYNENTKTWWYEANLNSVREGCIPACVVEEETKTAGINWRCLGLK
jgi:hypothetical protein